MIFSVPFDSDVHGNLKRVLTTIITRLKTKALNRVSNEIPQPRLSLGFQPFCVKAGSIYCTYVFSCPGSSIPDLGQ